MSGFIFNDQGNAGAVHVAELPAGINSRAALLAELSIAFRFPPYFGGNWDALWECICDLSWLPPGNVILRHKDLPLAKDIASLSIYLSILHDAVKKWKSTGSNLIFASPESWDATGGRELLVQRKFLVTFPADSHNIVESVLASTLRASGSSGGSRQ